MSEEQQEEKPLQFPNYGTPVATKKDAGPLIKMMTRMMPKRVKPRLMGKAKGLQSDQNVHVKHGKRKTKFY